ncbi:hypothetical protein NDU88_005734 [Pleurodeles waltl]|uniref:Uncharacterized protein n=1 Tax=Pleurodeles waltl TaxID=8319 RepID=A0AAV7WBW0_PLEWA|nr:hypothetical protein NDU88_005734 [Pleurodeles waltl]
MHHFTVVQHGAINPEARTVPCFHRGGLIRGGRVPDGGCHIAVNGQKEGWGERKTHKGRGITAGPLLHPQPVFAHQSPNLSLSPALRPTSTGHPLALSSMQHWVGGGTAHDSPTGPPGHHFPRCLGPTAASAQALLTCHTQLRPTGAQSIIQHLHPRCGLVAGEPPPQSHLCVGPYCAGSRATRALHQPLSLCTPSFYTEPLAQPDPPGLVPGTGSSISPLVVRSLGSSVSEHRGSHQQPQWCPVLFWVCARPALQHASSQSVDRGGLLPGSLPRPVTLAAGTYPAVGHSAGPLSSAAALWMAGVTPLGNRRQPPGQPSPAGPISSQALPDHPQVSQSLQTTPGPSGGPDDHGGDGWDAGNWGLQRRMMEGSGSVLGCNHHLDA